jgi:hypothetical protein
VAKQDSLFSFHEKKRFSTTVVTIDAFENFKLRSIGLKTCTKNYLRMGF